MSDSEAYDLFQRGLSLIEERHWAQATVPLEKAKRLEPDKSSIREALGRAYFRSGRYGNAASEFSAVVEQHPANDYAHFCLGRALEKLGDRRAAAAPHVAGLRHAPGPLGLQALPRPVEGGLSYGVRSSESGDCVPRHSELRTMRASSNA